MRPTCTLYTMSGAAVITLINSNSFRMVEFDNNDKNKDTFICHTLSRTDVLIRNSKFVFFETLILLSGSGQ